MDLPEGQRAVGVPLAGDAHAPWSLLTWGRPRFRAEGRREGETPEGHKAHRKQTPQPPWGVGRLCADALGSGGSQDRL